MAPTASMNMTIPEPVSAYLEGLANPDMLKPKREIGEVQAQLEKEDLTVAERLHLKGRLIALNCTDDKLAELAKQFVAAAPKYVESLGISMNDYVGLLRDENVVPPEVISSLVNGKTTTAKRARTTASQVEQVIKRSTGPFTYADIENQSGGSNGLVSRVVKQLVDADEVKDLGGTPKQFRYLA